MFAPLPTDLRRRAAVAAAAIVAVTIVVYLPVAHYGFLNYDDPAYVADNPNVTAGLTGEGVRWAFTTGHAGNWHPITWLSHMVDVELFGVAPGAHHVMNLVWHLAATCLLFWWLVRATHAVGTTVFVAGVFALHPTHVESVAWIAERKDVLSAFFWMATIAAYAFYLRERSALRYAHVIVLFALGLMAKPMVVTLPFALVLLHWWPFADADGARDFRDRLRAMLPALAPLFALSLASSVITYVVQQQAGAVRSLDALPWLPRLGYAVVAYLTYLVKAIWPVPLAPVYPPMPLSPVMVTAGVALLAALSYGAWRVRATMPAVGVGWAWFVGTLVPVIGIVQVGGQVVADRYTYLPYVGLAIAVAWLVRGWMPRLVAARPIAAAALAGAALIAFGVTARVYLSHWRSSEALWRHAAIAVPGNYRAHSNLGHAIETAGRLDEAITEYREAVRLRPTFAEGRTYLGSALADRGRPDEAIPELQEAVRLAPNYVAARNSLGLALAAAGRHEEAETQFREAVRLDPDFVPGHANLGVALATRGRLDAAIAAFEAAVRRSPSSSELRTNLARAITERGRLLVDERRLDDALRALDRAVEVQPGLPEAHHERGRVLAELGRLDEARVSLLEASRLAPGMADFHYDAAVVLVRQGRTADALRMLEAALRVDPDHAEARHAAEVLLGKSKG